MSNIERPSFFFDSFKKEAIFLAQKKIFEQVNKPSILKDKIQATIVPSDEHLELSNQDIDEIFLQVSEIIKRECLILSTTDVQKILREANAAMYWYNDKIKKDQEKARVKSIILEKTPQHLEKNLVMQIEKKITDEFANKIKKDILLFDENELTLNDDVLDRMIITTTENFTFSDDEIKRIHILLYNIAKLKLEELTCNKRKEISKRNNMRGYGVHKVKEMFGLPMLYNNKTPRNKCIWLWGKTGCGKSYLSHYYIYPDLNMSFICSSTWNSKFVNSKTEKIVLDTSDKISNHTLQKILSIVIPDNNSIHDNIKVFIIESYNAPSRIIKKDSTLKMLLEHTYVYDFSTPFNIEELDQFITSV